MALTPIQVSIELSPTGQALIRLAEVIGACDPATVPDEVKQAALDVLAIIEESRA